MYILRAGTESNSKNLYSLHIRDSATNSGAAQQMWLLEGQRTPIFPPGLECEGVVPPSAHGGHWGLACPLLASRDGGRNSRILEGGGFN